MNDKNASQAQQGADAFRKMAEEGVARFGAMLEESKKLEAKALEQATAAADESARLMKEGFSYAAQLSAEWRKLALESAQRSLELFTVRS